MNGDGWSVAAAEGRVAYRPRKIAPHERRPFLLPLAFAFCLCAAVPGFADEMQPPAQASVGVAPAEVPEIAPGILKGYLAKEALPNSTALLPPPPSLASAAQARDMQIASEALKLRGTPRWDLGGARRRPAFPPRGR